MSTNPTLLVITLSPIDALAEVEADIGNPLKLSDICCSPSERFMLPSRVAAVDASGVEASKAPDVEKVNIMTCPSTPVSYLVTSKLSFFNANHNTSY